MRRAGREGEREKDGCGKQERRDEGERRKVEEGGKQRKGLS